MHLYAFLKLILVNSICLYMVAGCLIKIQRDQNNIYNKHQSTVKSKQL